MKRTIAMYLVFALLVAMVPAFAPAVQATTMYSWPVPSVKTITQAYKGENTHGGIDIGGGNKNVYAICDGTVYARYTGCNNYSGIANGKCMNRNICTGTINTNTSNASYGYCNYGFGNGFIIKTSDGRYIQYAHFASISSLKKGDKVTTGTFLGVTGSSGYSNGAHLHLQVGTSAFANTININPTNSDITYKNGTGKGKAMLWNTSGTEQTSTFSFNANGGSGSMAAVTLPVGGSCTLPTNTFTRTGYAFKGWNVKRGDGTWYVSGVGWLTESAITSGGYTKKVYSDGSLLTYDQSWYKGLSALTNYTFYAIWEKTENTMYYFENYSGKNYLPDSSFKAGLNEDHYFSRDTSVLTVSIEDYFAFANPLLVLECWQPGASGKDLTIKTLTQPSSIHQKFVGDDRTFVLSFQAKSTLGTTMHIRWGYQSVEEYTEVALTSEWQSYVVPLVKAPEHGDSLHIYFDGFDSVSTIKLADLQLEDLTGSIDSYVPEYANEMGRSGSINFIPGMPLGGLPEPVRSGYRFEGWYTQMQGGTPVTADTIGPDGNFTVYAHWFLDDASRAEVDSGLCGDDVIWTLAEDGTMYIRGEGDMWDYEQDTVPWEAYLADIRFIIVKEGVTTIGKCAFSRCEELVSLELPDTLETIGGGAFDGCPKLTDLRLGAGVTKIEYSAFWGCTGLTKVDLNEKLVSIGSYAFYNCPGLTQLELPESLRVIEQQAFGGCDGLQSVVIPASVVDCGDAPFNGALMERIEVAEGNFVLYSEDGVLFKKDGPDIRLLQYPEARGAAGYTIPEGVTQIGREAFARCYDLKKVWMPDSVQQIGFGAFMGCSGLESVNISPSLSVLEDLTFSACKSLKNLVIPASVTQINDWAFVECSSLESVKFLGDAPEFVSEPFDYVTTVCNYPAGNATWTADVMQDYGGDLAWIVNCGDAHVETVVPGYPATCTTSGLSNGAYCSTCRDILTEQVEIAPIEHSYETAVIEATCEEPGYMVYTCTGCGDSYIDDEVPATGHFWANATCTEPKTCAACGLTEGEPVDHPYEAVVTAPGCETDGYITHTCAACGDSYTTAGDPATGHDWEAATCETPKTCAVCGATEGEKLSHDYESVVTAPGCETDGYITHTCVACGDSYTTDGDPATGHDYVATVTPPTCTEAGYTTHACTNCGDSYTDTPVKATGHGYQQVTTTPTCTEDGHVKLVCVRCGNEVIRSTEPALGHSYETNVVSPTCTEEGYTEHRCTTCGDYYQDEMVDAPGHSYETVIVDPSCTEDGYIGQVCQTCGDKVVEDTIYASGHSYEDVIVDPSCTEDGYIGRVCKTCGDVEVQDVIYSSGHDYANGVCTVCGAADPDAVVVDPGLTLNYPTLSFEDEIIYNVYFSVKDTSSVVEMGLMVLPKMDQNATIEDAVGLVPGYVTNGTVYLAKSEGVPAANMSDTLYFKVYAKLTDGTYAYSGAGGYNAKAYANSILKGNNSTEMKSLVVSMLNYGAEAQLFFGHNTDKLVNNALTAEQQALVKAYDTTMMDAIVKADSAKTGNFVRVNSNFRSLYPSVSFDGAFAINFYCQPAITVDSDMTLYYWDMETMEEVEKLSTDNATGSMVMEPTNGMYWGQVAGIAAKEMDKTYYVSCVFESNGETITTGVIPYSLGKYCSDKAAAEGDAQQSFAQATAVYGYYAKQYFASIA